jgi:hypothetical protein
MLLEDRSIPGSVLTRPDLSAALGSTLTLALDLTGTEALAVIPATAQDQHTQPAQMDAGDQTDYPPVAVGDLSQFQNLNSFGNLDTLHGLNTQVDPSSQLINLPAKHGQGNPPPPGGGDVVELGFLPGSSITIGTNSPITFGNDPPTDGVHNVSVGFDGTVFASQGDFYISSREFVIVGYHFEVQLQAQSDVTGTYDRTSGSATVNLALSVQITSPDAPSFDNNNCIIPATQLNMTTDNGTLFSLDPNDSTREVGTAVDNTFAAQAIPNRACGVYQGLVDYAQVINTQFGLPSGSGNNNFSLNLSMTPPIGP